MQGVHAEVRNYFRKSVHNYIVTARVLQGKEDIDGASPEEKRDIVMRWASRKHELRGFYLLKQKEKKGDAPAEGGSEEPDEEPKTGWLHTRHLSLEERRKLHEQKDAWKRRQAERQAANVDTSTDDMPAYTPDENDELEEAIMASVRQTSHGDRYEDARIEQAIRASVVEMRRIANRRGREEKGGVIVEEEETNREGPTAAVAAAAARAGLASGLGPPGGVPGEPNLDISDEEYQQLIAEAVRLSLTEQQASAALGHASPEEDEDFRRALEESRTYNAAAGRAGGINPDDDSDEDEMLRRALEESTRSTGPPPLPARSPGTAAEEQTEGVLGGESHGDDDDDELLRRAIEESERAHREHLERHQTEEEEMLELAKQQSLAEEERRRQQTAKGKGKAPATADDDDDDEDLKRALEESLRATGRVGEGSGWGSRKGKEKAHAEDSGPGPASGWGSGWKAQVEATAKGADAPGQHQQQPEPSSAETPSASSQAPESENSGQASGGKDKDTQ